MVDPLMSSQVTGRPQFFPCESQFHFLKLLGAGPNPGLKRGLSQGAALPPAHAGGGRRSGGRDRTLNLPALPWPPGLDPAQGARPGPSLQGPLSWYRDDSLWVQMTPLGPTSGLVCPVLVSCACLRHLLADLCPQLVCPQPPPSEAPVAAVRVPGTTVTCSLLRPGQFWGWPGCWCCGQEATPWRRDLCEVPAAALCPVGCCSPRRHPSSFPVPCPSASNACQPCEDL